MLTGLAIRDVVLIEALDLEFGPGLGVLTGETGAGKSILVDALQLLAGGRAGAEVVRHGAERAEISGTFDIAQAPRELKQWLEEQSLSGGEELIIRRVVAADGRSRAYLNGQSVSLQLLREAGNILIDIHGQHEFQSLMRGAAQRELLDGYGKNDSLAAQVGMGFAFAHHFASFDAVTAMTNYRQHFRPSPWRTTPSAILAVAVIAAETDAEAERLAAPMELNRLRRDRGEYWPLPSVEEALAYPYTDAERAAIARNRSRLFVGSPATVMAKLEPMIAECQADELMVITAVFDHEARKKSYSLLAEAFGLEKRTAA